MTNWTRAEIKPDKEHRVLVTVLNANTGRRWTQIATYVRQFSRECSGDDDDRFDVELGKNEVAYWPEGWYEDYDEERVCRVSDPVLAWAPLPDPYDPTKET